MSYRSDDVGRGTRCDRWLAELGRHPRAQRLDLRPFTPIQVAEQLGHLTGRRPSAQAIDRVVENTLGAAAAYLDDAVAGVAHIERALELAVACGDAEEQMCSYWNRAVCVSEGGDRRDASEHQRAAIGGAATPRSGPPVAGALHLPC